MQSAYQACSVFALPSLLETPGLAALEALVSGSKLVITSEGCTEEYFGEYAHYVSPLDVNAIADGINSALLAPAPVISEDIDFSWHRTAKELEQAYIMAIAKTK